MENHPPTKNTATFTAQPLISVIVPVYNGEQFLAEALTSIFAQDYRPLEVLVVDDGSTDGSARVAESFAGARLLRKAHSGVASTLNHGARHASGELLAFLDADDRWLSGKLTRQLSELTRRPELDMVFTHARQFTTLSTATGSHEQIVATQPAVSKVTLLIRRTSFWQVGEFAEQAIYHDFLEWYARAMAVGLQAITLPDILVERRIHQTNTGRTATATQHSQYLNTLRAVVQQRRQQTQNSDSAGE